MRKVLSLPQAQTKPYRGHRAMSLRFDLTDIRLFLHVAEAGSITGGAARAGMALASASERIRAMEEELGTALLTRKRRGVRPTQAGLALLHHARLVTEQLQHMRGELSEYAKGLRGHVRLLANTVALAELLPGALARFLSDHPNIDVELEDRPSPEIVRTIAEGRADIGIITDSIGPSEELQTFPIGTIRLVGVVPTRHPLGRRQQVAFRDVVDYDFVGLPAGSALQDYLDHHAARAGRRLKIRLRLNGFDPICRMVDSGIGLAVLPETAARRCQRMMKIRVVALTDTWALRHHAICVRNLRSLPAHAQQLVEGLRPRSP
jgi:molybdate transport repressor ModE-like protein